MLRNEEVYRVVKFDNTKFFYKQFKISLFNPNKWDLNHRYDELGSVLNKRVVFTLINFNNDVSIGTYDIIFWYNKKLYILKDISLYNFKAFTPICYIDHKPVFNHFKINPIKEKLLFYWLKINFYIKYLKAPK
jgi:hypothetical protein